MSRPLVEVEDLWVGFPTAGGDVFPIRGISFGLERGERLGIVGESGCGKSLTALSLMRLIPGHGRVARGQIRLEGEDLLGLPEHEMMRVRGQRIAMIYQDPMSSLNPVLTVGRQIGETLRVHLGMSRRAARARAIELLDEVGVPEAHRRVDRYPHEFSGGMRQRVMIAIALSAEPDVLIADEPTTALDVTTQARMIDLLDRLVDEHGTSVILITHDLAVAAGFCSSIQVMYAGRIVERSGVSTLFSRPLHPYTEALLESICDLTADPEVRISAIPGQPPEPSAFPSGCSFHPRCPYARDRCTHEFPAPWRPRENHVECHFAEERYVGDERFLPTPA